MLVLTRRKNQEILFPNLGVTIKVVDIKGKILRLGIDAPKEIRIARGELKPFSHEQFPNHSSYQQTVSTLSKPKGSRQNELSKIDLPLPIIDEIEPARIDSLVHQLDAANLAIHLAQNQLQQGRTNYAEASLQHAIDCLQAIEVAMGLVSLGELNSVHETVSDYKVREQPRAIILEGESSDRHKVARHLQAKGIQVVEQQQTTLHAIMRMHHQPRHSLVMMLQPKDSKRQSIPLPSISIGSLNSLTLKTQLDVAGCQATTWTLRDSCHLDLAS